MGGAKRQDAPGIASRDDCEPRRADPRALRRRSRRKEGLRLLRRGGGGCAHVLPAGERLGAVTKRLISRSSRHHQHSALDREMSVQMAFKASPSGPLKHRSNVHRAARESAWMRSPEISRRATVLEGVSEITRVPAGLALAGAGCSPGQQPPAMASGVSAPTNARRHGPTSPAGRISGQEYGQVAPTVIATMPDAGIQRSSNAEEQMSSRPSQKDGIEIPPARAASPLVASPYCRTAERCRKRARSRARTSARRARIRSTRASSTSWRRAVER